MEVVIIVLLMFLPFVIALVKGNSNVVAVFLVNLLTGWTGVGWVFALLMAFAGSKPVQQVYIVNQPTTYDEPSTPTTRSDWDGARNLIPRG